MMRTAIAALALAGAAMAADPLLFVYSKDSGEMGVFFAASADGQRWMALNSGKVWLPVEPASERMRDPSIVRGAGGGFEMVWKRWSAQSSGYAYSPDLVHWSEQIEMRPGYTAPFATTGPGEVEINGERISARRGSFLKITAEELKRVEAARGSTWAAVAQSLPDLYHDDKFGDPPYLTESGWGPLLNGRDLAGWHADGGASNDWFTAAGVSWRRVFAPTHLTAKAAPGDRIVNGKEGKTANLVSDARFGSFELYLEFLLARGSNSGVFLHGLYEVQIFDSFGFEGPMTVGDCGGIYEQPQGGGGSPPARNAARPPGEWQSLRIWFQAPQFDGAGKMMARPKIARVVLNGVPVQENFTLPGPTLSHMEIAPAAVNPILLQGDHGPVAYRNIYIKPLDQESAWNAGNF